MHVNPSRLAIVGDSVGGNMAAALVILAKERGGPKITFQVLFYPVTDGTNFNSSSYIKLQNGYWLTRQAMKWFWDNYAPNKVIRKQPTASPLQASIEQLRGLLPALIITGSMYFTQRARPMLTSSLMQVSPLLQSDILVLPTTL
ncbi:MAG: alpha/beta hydrolase fold domain-containing protein [Candidatus Nitrosopolaris sp.]|jgi:acetyl esterase